LDRASVTAYPNGGGSEVEYVDKGGKTFRTVAPPQYDLTTELLKNSVKVTANAPSNNTLTAFLVGWAPFLLVLGFWLFFMRQMQSGGNKALSFGKSKAKLSSSAQKKVTFKDVAGVDEAKDELQ